MKHWAEIHGHSLTREEVAGVTGMAMSQITGHPGLIASPGPYAGSETYAAAQFDQAGAPTPGLDVIATALGDDIDSWDLVAFLTSPLPALSGQTAFGWLQAGGDVSKVIRLAS